MKNSTLLRKITSLFVFIILPLLLLGSIFLFWVTHRLKSDTLQFHAATVRHHAETLDYSFEEIYDLSMSIFSRSELKKIAYTFPVLDTHERNRIILQLQEFIRSVKNNSDLIQSIRIYTHSPDEYFLVTTGDSSALSATHLDGTANDITFKKISEDIFQFWANRMTMPFEMISENDRLFLMLKNSQNDPVNLIVTEYSLPELEKELNQQLQYGGSYYLFNFRNGEFLLDNMEDAMRQEVLKLPVSADSRISKLNLSGTQYYVFYSELENLDASYVQVIPGSVFLQPITLSNIYTVAFILIMILCIIIFFNAAVRIIHNPMTKLVNAFQIVEDGDLSIRIHDSSPCEFGYLYTGFNHMTEHLESLINEIYLQKLLRQKAEFKQLQSQINPHFLYNSFFMLQRMIQDNMQEESIEVSRNLGLYFKYITRTQSDFVSLKDEYLYAKIYSDIQAMRFEGRITTEFAALPSFCAGWLVPRLILQPVIENAYNYGLEEKCSDGLLMVNFLEHEDGLFIIVEDNGENLSDAKLSKICRTLCRSASILNSQEITGLSNICRRLQLFSRSNSFLTAARSELGGLKVSIFLSKENEENFNETPIDRG